MLKKITLSKKIVYLTSAILIIQIIILSSYHYYAQQQIIESFKNQGDFASVQVNKTLIISLLISVGVIIFGVLLSYFLSQKIASPIKGIAHLLQKMSKGEDCSFDISYKGNDEIKEVTDAAYQMCQNQKQYLEFAQAIAQGDFSKQIAAQGALKESLLSMRENLQETKEADRRRDWVNTGIARFANLVRETSQEDISHFYSSIVSEIVKYLEVNQGALFILQETEDNKQPWYLELNAVYAYDKNKYLEKTIPYGKGLLSEAVLQKEAIYVTEVPQNYVQITSGLGEALPDFVLISPLIYKDEVLGVLELASFGAIEDYQKDYIAQVSESIASVLVSNKINTKTRMLLEESEKNAEALKAKEEMMQQNLADLQENEQKMLENEEKMQELLSNLKENEKEMEQNLKVMQENEQKMLENEQKTQELLQHLQDKEKEMEKKWMIHESELNVVMEEISGNLEAAQKSERTLKKSNQFYDLALEKLNTLLLVYKQRDLDQIEFVSDNIIEVLGFEAQAINDGTLTFSDLLFDKQEAIVQERKQRMEQAEEGKFSDFLSYTMKNNEGIAIEVKESFRLISPKKGKRKFILSCIYY